MISPGLAARLTAQGIDPGAGLDAVRDRVDYLLAETTARRGIGYTRRIEALQDLADALMDDEDRAAEADLVARLRASLTR